VLVAVERSGTTWRVPIKALASSGFLALALAAGAFESRYGMVLFTGLSLAWIGDLLLALPSRRAFLGGLIAFLLGHVAYLVAFGVRGWRVVVLVVASVVLVAPAVAVWRWLRPHLDGPMVPAVAAYVVVISSMVAAAIATGTFDLDLRIVAGAILFFVSDLFVARQRFVTPGFVNRAWGLPLYYAGQVLLALSVG
jgi:uncharacterized membrane protein YhhN